MNCICTHSAEAHDGNGCRLCPCFRYRPRQADALAEFDSEMAAKLNLHAMAVFSEVQ
jgi:hypothetical protein